ncbi:SRPBCC family protein [Streptomyces rimosus]|uniref:SRPBCC family protein n=1 Tax=Streptomyces rimosus TaxID=1927 RepID=UPI00099DA322|nr:SRPBCC family protein [Streptomyces rimosus]
MAAPADPSQNQSSFRTGAVSKLEPFYAEAFASAVIPARITTVSRVVRDFAGLAAWQPAVAGCVLADTGAPDRVGCVRTLSMADGKTVVESLLALDDRTRSLTYGIVSSPCPVQSYRATLRVLRDVRGRDRRPVSPG